MCQDFDHERKKLEKVIDVQRKELAELKAKVEELTLNAIGDHDKNPTVVTLRKEFRKILQDVHTHQNESEDVPLTDSV